MIEIKNVSKVFKTVHGDFTALDRIDLTIPDGDVFGIIGLSGAGKSTLVRCINLLEMPSDGEIFIDGIPVTTLKKKELLELRRTIGMVFQKFNLLMQRTVAENVEFPMEISGKSKTERKKRALELLELVGLEDKAESYPAQLSGGQQQRVSIARALANDPSFLLCDEPTSALDTLTTNSILRLLRDINQKLGVTMVVITHEISVVEKICSKVAIIDGGRIIESGNAKSILSKPSEAITKSLIEQEKWDA